MLQSCRMDAELKQKKRAENCFSTVFIRLYTFIGPISRRELVHSQLQLTIKSSIVNGPRSVSRIVIVETRRIEASRYRITGRVSGAYVRPEGVIDAQRAVG